MKPNLERLNYLAREVLPYVEEEKWDMDVWFKHTGYHDLPKPILLDCGTSACALGHMALSPKGIRDGWTWKFSGSSGLPMYKRSHTLEAAKNYFGIAYDESYWLFMPDDNPTPAMVAERIESLIKAYS